MGSEFSHLNCMLAIITSEVGIMIVTIGMALKCRHLSSVNTLKELMLQIYKIRKNGFAGVGGFDVKT